MVKKKETIKNVRENPKGSYKKLRGFFFILKKANPNTYTEIKNDENSNFRYKFMAIRACINGFIKYIKQVIVVN